MTYLGIREIVLGTSRTDMKKALRGYLTAQDLVVKDC
jgi:hypothetical protein